MRSEFTRWPTLLAGTSLATTGVAIDLTTHAPVAFALWALSAACFGAFLYAEGARHREWNDQGASPPPDVPSRHGRDSDASDGV